MDLKTDIKRMLTLGSIDQTLRDIKRHSDVLDTERYAYFDKVIDVYDGRAETPKECLAIAYVYMYKGAAYRTKAIRYFEKYLLKPVKVDGYRGIYLDLGKLYEAEYDFVNAEKYYKLFTQANRNITVGYIVLAHLYSKIDIHKAVDFLFDVLMSDYAKDEAFRRYIRIEYEACLKKQEDGYVYKPRKEEAVYNQQLEETKQEIADDRRKDDKNNKRNIIKIVAAVLILFLAAKCSNSGEDKAKSETSQESTTIVTESTSETSSLSFEENEKRKREDIKNSVDNIKKTSDEIWNDPEVKESRESLKQSIKDNIYNYGN